MFNIIDEDNFKLFAIRYYNNPHCIDTSEFEDDLKRFKYLKRLLNKYAAKGILKDRLIINHLIVLFNVFHHEALIRMLNYKLNEFMYILKPFLVLLGYMPDCFIDHENNVVYNSSIPIDRKVLAQLRDI